MYKARPLRIAVAVTCAAIFLLASAAAAQDRPSDEDIFGKPAQEERPAPPAPPPGAAQPAPGERSKPAPPAAEAERGGPRALEPEPGVEGRLFGSLSKTEDPLKIGGVLYLRSNLLAREHTPPSQWTLDAPTLTDVYLDVRPTDRVRGFVLGRMFFDPTLTSSATGLVPGATQPPNPQVLLDQLWLRFDVERTAFVTLGRQHVKWGVGRFWNPTDYLHAVKRNPLAVFDERTGTTMARVHVPWEARGWNFSAVAVFEPLVTQASTAVLASQVGQGATEAAAQPATASNQLGAIGGGARAEIVLGTWELGLDAVAQRGIRPRYGIDLSGGIWELDVRGELAVRTSSDVPLYRGTLASFATYEPSGIRPMAVVAADWSHKYSDEDTFTVGAEYFYNSNGYRYDERGLYPVLLANNAFTPFYLGRHYAGAYLLLPKPGSWNLHSFTLSVLGNLSDRSAVARLDWSVTLLTYLVAEAYLQGHFGTNGGEFRLGLDVPPTTVTPAVFLGAPIADVGVALRLSL